MTRILISIAALIAWTGLSFWAGREWRDGSADLVESQQQTSAVQREATSQAAARAQEHQQATQLATIGAKHEEDRAAAPAVADAVVAGLRDGTLRLRNDLAACHTERLSEAAAGTLERDAATQRREEFAGRVVRIGRDADDQLRACQAVVVADRSGVSSDTAQP